ncbi:MGMT family protein [bacterium]|nr:MGMT family protein [bacterium]
MKSGRISFLPWDFTWKVVENKVIESHFIDHLAKADSFKYPYYEEFKFYFTNGRFSKFPSFEIQGVSEKQNHLLMTLFENWNDVLFYGELAELSGFPGAARFAGTCMAKNPLPVLIPCHHVLGKSDPWKFTGPSALKKALLELENRSIEG